MTGDQDRRTVIIGAGLGGLCCGALLARDGVPVTIVEQHLRPGGDATSFEREDGRFDFEVSLHGTALDENATAEMLSWVFIKSLCEFKFVSLFSLLSYEPIGIALPGNDPLFVNWT